MKTVQISLNSIDKVKSFVNDITKFDYDFDLVSGRYVIDAKSIMGIFSLDLSKPIDLNIHLKDGTVKTYETLKLRSNRHEATSTEEFAGKIRCASCGNLYHKYCCYGKYTYWRCSGKSRVRTECGGRDFQDSDIRKISAYLMGMTGARTGTWSSTKDRRKRYGKSTGCSCTGIRLIRSQRC